ncbi:MAG: choice-of-anchor tandem repeat GloVer-containing protein [Bryobacteraceae bacterium]
MAPKLKLDALLWSASALAILAMAPPRAQAQATEVVLHAFASPPKGEGLWAGVIRDKTGNLYGTAVDGGPTDLGVVFKVDTAGHATVLHGFTGGSDGERPYAGVVGDSAGNLYGTAYLGGTYDAGIVYKVDATGQETVLYTFTGGADGGMPIAGVTLDSAGNLYGCASAGGSAHDGVVFKLDPTGHETVLHSFTGSPSDGAGPQAALLLDSAGNLYGTTYSGGFHCGRIEGIRRAVAATFRRSGLICPTLGSIPSCTRVPSPNTSQA